MKKGMNAVKISSFISIFLATFLPGLASADRYNCLNPQTNQATIISNPNQCPEPSLVSIITNADLTRLKNAPRLQTPGRQATRMPGGAGSEQMVVTPGAGRADSTAPICGKACISVRSGNCSYYYCCCEDMERCWIEDVQCTPPPPKKPRRPLSNRPTAPITMGYFHILIGVG